MLVLKFLMTTTCSYPYHNLMPFVLNEFSIKILNEFLFPKFRCLSTYIANRWSHIPTKGTELVQRCHLAVVLWAKQETDKSDQGKNSDLLIGQAINLFIGSHGSFLWPHVVFFAEDKIQIILRPQTAMTFACSANQLQTSRICKNQKDKNGPIKTSTGSGYNINCLYIPSRYDTS